MFYLPNSGYIGSLKVLEFWKNIPGPWKSLNLNVPHYAHCTIKHDRNVLLNDFSMDYIWHYISAPRPPPGLCPWTSLGDTDSRPPDSRPQSDPMTLVFENCNFRSLKSPWILSFQHVSVMFFQLNIQYLIKYTVQCILHLTAVSSTVGCLNQFHLPSLLLVARWQVPVSTVFWLS